MNKNSLYGNRSSISPKDEIKLVEIFVKTFARKNLIRQLMEMGSVLFNTKNSTNFLLIEQFLLILERSTKLCSRFFLLSDKRPVCMSSDSTATIEMVLCDDYDGNDDDDDEDNGDDDAKEMEKWSALPIDNSVCFLCVYFAMIATIPMRDARCS